jgi:hypothetical protein
LGVEICVSESLSVKNIIISIISIIIISIIINIIISIIRHTGGVVSHGCVQAGLELRQQLAQFGVKRLAPLVVSAHVQAEKNQTKDQHLTAEAINDARGADLSKSGANTWCTT